MVKSVIEEIDNGVFGLLVDESADVSDKEQMGVVLEKRRCYFSIFVYT